MPHGRSECWRRMACVILVAAGGCSSTSPRPSTLMQLHEDDAITQREIAMHVPRGTSVAEATRFMKAEGFDCSIQFSDGRPYLYCVEHRTWKFPVDRKWQVHIDYENDKTTDIFVSSGLVGP